MEGYTGQNFSIPGHKFAPFIFYSVVIINSAHTHKVLLYPAISLRDAQNYLSSSHPSCQAAVETARTYTPSAIFQPQATSTPLDRLCKRHITHQSTTT